MAHQRFTSAIPSHSFTSHSFDGLMMGRRGNLGWENEGRGGLSVPVSLGDRLWHNGRYH